MENPMDAYWLWLLSLCPQVILSTHTLHRLPLLPPYQASMLKDSLDSLHHYQKRSQCLACESRPSLRLISSWPSLEDPFLNQLFCEVVAQDILHLICSQCSLCCLPAFPFSTSSANQMLKSVDEEPFYHLNYYINQSIHH